MEVKIQNSTVITSNSISRPFELPLNIFDRLAININVSIIYAFTPPTPPNSKIICALRKTLTHFPTLTAHLRYDSYLRPCSLVVGSEDDSVGGALVVEATVNSELADHLPLQPSPDFLLLHPPVDQATGKCPYVLQVQLNRFRCGGLVIGVTNHHKVADGQSMSHFFTAWGQAVRGVPIDPLPDLDQFWLNPRSPPRCEYEHWNREFIANPCLRDDNICITTTHIVPVCKITCILLHFSEDFIKYELKSKMRDEYTRFEILAAHLWKKITLARGLHEDEITTLSVSVNGRPRLKPQISWRYFGNLVIDAQAPLKVKDLLKRSLEDIAKMIKDSIKMTNEGYLQSVIDFGELNRGEDLVPLYGTTEVNTLSPMLEVDSWLRFGFENVDFGCGSKLCAFLPTWMPIEGLAILLPSLSDEGGVQVCVTLREEHAETLKREYLSAN